MFEVKNASRKGEYGRAKALLLHAFPPDELVPTAQLRLFTFIRKGHFLSFYDEERFVGIVYYVNFKDSSYIFYLAVNPDERKKGYGSGILDYVKETNPGNAVILDVEAPVGSGLEKKLSRIEFYHRNGIVDTSYMLYDNGIKYMVLSSKPESFNPQDLVKCWRGYAFGLFKEKPFKE